MSDFISSSGEPTFTWNIGPSWEIRKLWTPSLSQHFTYVSHINWCYTQSDQSDNFHFSSTMSTAFYCTIILFSLLVTFPSGKHFAITTAYRLSTLFYTFYITYIIFVHSFHPMGHVVNVKHGALAPNLHMSYYTFCVGTL